MRRPDPLHWIAYAFGAGLPARNNEWVLYDVTAPTWWLRHLGRATVQLLPLLVILYLVVPGPPWVRLMGSLAGALIGYFYSVAYMNESAETRVGKAGYPVGTAAASTCPLSFCHQSSPRKSSRAPTVVAIAATVPLRGL